MTLLPGVLERARQTLYLVSGADKTAALRNVLREPPNPLQRPAQIGAAEIDWYVDDGLRGLTRVGSTTRLLFCSASRCRS